VVLGRRERSGSSSGSLATHAVRNNNSGLKSVSPMAVFGAGERDKQERKDELVGGQGIRDDAAGDSSGIPGSNSKSIKSSSDRGDIQDHVMMEAPTLPLPMTVGAAVARANTLKLWGPRAAHLDTKGPK
jgi:hypothetical protein